MLLVLYGVLGTPISPVVGLWNEIQQTGPEAETVRMAMLAEAEAKEAAIKAHWKAEEDGMKSIRDRELGKKPSKQMSARKTARCESTYKQLSACCMFY